MLKLIALNYTVMLNGGKQFYRDILLSGIMAISDKKDAIKEILKYTVYVVCTLI